MVESEASEGLDAAGETLGLLSDADDTECGLFRLSDDIEDGGRERRGMGSLV